MPSSAGGQHFQRFVDAGQPVGEVLTVNNFLVAVKGLQPVNIHALVTFEDGSKGFVSQILDDRVKVLHLGSAKLRVGSLAVVQQTELMAKVGKDFIGRVVSTSGEPLDGKGAIAADGTWPIFNFAPPIYERELLAQQLETGIVAIDSLFPIVRGQRMALLGDSKLGKSTLASQIAINQKNTDQIVVYVLIAKRRSDIDNLINHLSDNGALKKAIVIVSTIFDSLVASYLAPYVGCAMAEYLWQSVGQDVVVVYDDLTTHAHAYREISLLSGVSPGRDSYPGDMFHAHSSLLERAGRLKKNGNSLTAISILMADSGDITAFLPTNIMSITDGQWILDNDLFREGVRPAIHPGLSVTRVGGRGHNEKQKQQNGQALKALNAYQKAKEFSHFGTELSANTQTDLIRGEKIRQLLSQVPGETYSVMAQQMLLDVLLEPTLASGMDVGILKKSANEVASLVKNAADYPHLTESLKAKGLGISP